MASVRRPPWKKSNPRKAKAKAKPKAAKALSPAQKTAARRRAKAAGRPYPNLVDNMQVAAGRKRAKKRK